MKNRLLTAILALLLLAGCGAKPVPVEEPETVPGWTPSRTLQTREARERNPDVAGWLYIPDTGIDDPILQTPGELNSSNKYLTHDIDGRADGWGCYFADGRAPLGSGTRAELACLTAVYGRSASDDPASGRFAGIKHFRDEQFAREHPYLFFSTAQEDLVFEIVAVFEAHVNLPYNRPDLEEGQYAWMLDAVRDSSLYDYFTQFDTDDRLLVLSTTAMAVQGHPSLPAFSEYRFAVMGKLLPEGAELQPEAAFTPSPLPAWPDMYDHTDWIVY